MDKKPGEPDWELDCRCNDCEYQREYYGRTFEETQAMAQERLNAPRKIQNGADY